MDCINNNVDYGLLKDDRRIVFKIPIGKRNKKWWQFWKKSDAEVAKKEISKLMEDYNQKVSFNDETGEILFNDEYKIPMAEDIWLPIGTTSDSDVKIENVNIDNIDEEKIKG